MEGAHPITKPGSDQGNIGIIWCSIMMVITLKVNLANSFGP